MHVPLQTCLHACALSPCVYALSLHNTPSALHLLSMCVQVLVHAPKMPTPHVNGNSAVHGDKGPVAPTVLVVPTKLRMIKQLAAHVNMLLALAVVDALADCKLAAAKAAFAHGLADID
jgi:hypothetical protein